MICLSNGAMLFENFLLFQICRSTAHSYFLDPVFDAHHDVCLIPDHWERTAVSSRWVYNWFPSHLKTNIGHWSAPITTHDWEDEHPSTPALDLECLDCYPSPSMDSVFVVWPSATPVEYHRISKNIIEPQNTCRILKHTNPNAQKSCVLCGKCPIRCGSTSQSMAVGEAWGSHQHHNYLPESSYLISW